MTRESLVVMLVEDNPHHAELLVRWLGQLGLGDRVVRLTDGEAALAYLFRQGSYTDPHTSPRPHLILMDLRLPRVDGLNVLEQVKAAEDLCRIPVLIVTSSTAEQDLAGAFERRADAYLVKPVELGAFTQVLKDLGLR